MDIQGHIIDVWIGKTSKEHPIITIYDPEGRCTGNRHHPRVDSS